MAAVLPGLARDKQESTPALVSSDLPHRADDLWKAAKDVAEQKANSSTRAQAKSEIVDLVSFKTLLEAPRKNDTQFYALLERGLCCTDKEIREHALALSADLMANECSHSFQKIIVRLIQDDSLDLKFRGVLVDNLSKSIADVGGREQLSDLLNCFRKESDAQLRGKLFTILAKQSGIQLEQVLCEEICSTRDPKVKSDLFALAAKPLASAPFTEMAHEFARTPTEESLRVNALKYLAAQSAPSYDSLSRDLINDPNVSLCAKARLLPTLSQELVQQMSFQFKKPNNGPQFSMPNIVGLLKKESTAPAQIDLINALDQMFFKPDQYSTTVDQRLNCQQSLERFTGREADPAVKSAAFKLMLRIGFRNGEFSQAGAYKIFSAIGPSSAEEIEVKRKDDGTIDIFIKFDCGTYQARLDTNRHLIEQAFAV